MNREKEIHWKNDGPSIDKTQICLAYCRAFGIMRITGTEWYPIHGWKVSQNAYHGLCLCQSK